MIAVQSWYGLFIVKLSYVEKSAAAVLYRKENSMMSGFQPEDWDSKLVTE